MIPFVKYHLADQGSSLDFDSRCQPSKVDRMLLDQGSTRMRDRKAARRRAAFLIWHIPELCQDGLESDPMNSHH